MHYFIVLLFFSILPLAMAYQHSMSQVISPPKNIHTSTRFVAKTILPTANYGQLIIRAYEFNKGDTNFDVLAIIKDHQNIHSRGMTRGETTNALVDPITNITHVRVHDQCLTSEVFGSLRCDCREQLHKTLEKVKNEPYTVLIYLLQEGRGIGLANKIASYSLQDGGLDTVDANIALGFDEDIRTYEAVKYILEDLSIKNVDLITNNPRKVSQLKDLGIPIVSTQNMCVTLHFHNSKYLKSKKNRMSHQLDLSEIIDAPNTPNIKEIASSVKWNLGRKSVEDAIQAFKEGKFVILTDDIKRENEGDLILPAVSATPEKMAYLIEHTSGVICSTMEEEHLKILNLPQMIEKNEDSRGTAFALSVDLKDGTTGISARSRSNTLNFLAQPPPSKSEISSFASKLQRPGHIFPLKSRKYGVYERRGHTEASVDLFKLAFKDLPPVVAIGEIVSKINKTEMAQMDEIEKWSKQENIVFTTIEDLLCYKLETEFGYKIPSS